MNKDMINIYEFKYEPIFDNIEPIRFIIKDLVERTDPMVICDSSFNCYEFLLLDDNTRDVILNYERKIGFIPLFKYVMYEFYSLTNDIIENELEQNYMYEILKKNRYNYRHDTNFKKFGNESVNNYVRQNLKPSIQSLNSEIYSKKSRKIHERH